MITGLNLKVHNGQYVTALSGGGRELWADTNAPLEWESFAIVNLQNKQLADGDSIAIQAMNGQFVSVANGGGGQVMANANNIGPWETFKIRKIVNNKFGKGAISNNSTVAFLCNDGKHYFCAENGGGRELVANRLNAGIWETFQLNFLTKRRIRIEIESIYCNNTEDVTGSDSLYLFGAVASRLDGKSCAVLTSPIEINNGETKHLLPNQNVIFDDVVDSASTISIGLRAMDQDAAKSWGDRGAKLEKMSKDVSGALSLLGPKGVAAGKVLEAGVSAANFIVSLDTDDVLGDLATDIPVVTLPRPSSRRTWPFSKRGWGYSTWSYTVTYRIWVD